MRPHIMVLGYAGHGKDAVCDILKADYGFGFESSSHFVAEKAVRPWMEKKGICYSSFDEMYADRVNHRADWFNAIAAYNHPDLGRLGRELFQQFNIYCGIRNASELHILQKEQVIDFTFWVDASKRLPPEPSNSITVRPDDADYIIDNNGPLVDLRKNVQETYFKARSGT